MASSSWIYPTSGVVNWRVSPSPNEPNIPQSRFFTLRLACSVGSVCFVWACCKAMGYADNTPSQSITPFARMGWPSNAKEPQLNRAAGRHPNIHSAAQADVGVPPRREGSTKSLPKVFPGGVTPLFYPKPIDRRGDAAPRAYPFTASKPPLNKTHTR